MKLVLGVIDIPYQNPPSQKKIPQAKKGKANKPVHVVNPTEQTTGDVATWLENKYQVMERFVDLHQKDINQAIEKSVSGALESLMMGAPASFNPFGAAASEIETLFKFTYLDKEEIVKTGAAGVPTEAALKGVNHRLKKGKGASRPSFIDTGQYESTMKVWTE
ncbi:hypothetical protein AB4Y43_01375 [Paraburkholderia sp. BR10872]|uniref:hypothetical protein n=1 Tax=Paraburkholderia sp. BR10872 TaxID=3236989 RepID=UPI0034D28AB7